MRKYKIKVIYARKGSQKKEIELECNEYPVASLVDSFVIEEIMTREEPDLVSIYPLIKSVPRGSWIFTKQWLGVVLEESAMFRFSTKAQSL